MLKQRSPKHTLCLPSSVVHFTNTMNNNFHSKTKSFIFLRKNLIWIKKKMKTLDMSTYEKHLLHLEFFNPIVDNLLFPHVVLKVQLIKAYFSSHFNRQCCCTSSTITPLHIYTTKKNHQTMLMICTLLLLNYFNYF